MCGIYGIAPRDPGGHVDPETLRRMGATLRHRGPDSQGELVAPGIGLGVQRLSIIDLETGNQPVASEDGTLTLVCNGEIYNAPELRQALEARGHRFRSRSDVEAIVHLYEERGVDCLAALRGMFAFAIWDSPRRQLMLARDRLGIKPLYFASRPRGLAFGSEQKAVLAAGDVERQLDPQALEDLFVLGFVAAPRTFVAAIRQLLPGCYLLYRDGRLTTHRYWDLSYAPGPDDVTSRRIDAWAEALRETLEESVRLHLRSDVPVGVWLSGGVDSSSVAALTSRARPGAVPAFSLTFDDQPADEVSHLRTLDMFPGSGLAGSREPCRIADFALLPRVLRHAEDPFTLGLELPRLVLSRASARQVKVVLTGEGSDEVLGGYPWFRRDRRVRALGGLPRSVRRLLAWLPLALGRGRSVGQALLAPSEMRLARYAALVGPFHAGPWTRLLSGELRSTLGATGEREERLAYPDGFDAWTPAAQLQYHDVKLLLPDCTVRALDRSSMACSLEARVPFLDHQVVELTARMPAAVKQAGPLGKEVLRRAMRGNLPAEILARPKLHFIAPYDAWFRARLPDFAVDALSRERLRATGYFDPEVVAGMLARHRAGRDRHGRHLLGVLSTQLWHDLGAGRP